MIKLYHASRTRSVRILWLLEELGIPYQLETVAFVPPDKPYTQATPSGKFPTLQDDDAVLFESGAIMEYLIEKYGNGRFAPAPGSSNRAAYLQWLHFCEGTAFPAIANIAWHTFFKRNADEIPDVINDYRGWAAANFGLLDKALDGKNYLLGDEFSGADMMMGFTLWCAGFFGLLGEAYPNLTAYMARLQARPAFQRAFES